MRHWPKLACSGAFILPCMHACTDPPTTVPPTFVPAPCCCPHAVLITLQGPHTRLDETEWPEHLRGGAAPAYEPMLANIQARATPQCMHCPHTCVQRNIGRDPLPDMLLFPTDDWDVQVRDACVYAHCGTLISRRKCLVTFARRLIRYRTQPMLRVPATDFCHCCVT